MISASHVTKIAGGRTVLEDVTLQVARRECVRLGGPRNSGRTTLLRILGTLVPPTTGAVWIDGTNATADPLHARRRIAYVDPAMPGGSRLTVEEYLWVVARARGTRPGAEAGELLKRAGVAATTGIDRLPGAVRAAVAVAAALSGRPDVLLLADVLSGAGDAARQAIVDSIRDARANGAAVVVVADDESELTTACGRNVMLERGRVQSVLTGDTGATAWAR